MMGRRACEQSGLPPGVSYLIRKFLMKVIVLPSGCQLLAATVRGCSWLASRRPSHCEGQVPGGASTELGVASPVHDAGLDERIWVDSAGRELDERQ